MVKKIKNALGDVNEKTIAFLGITFKPETDDMREAPSLVIIPELVKMGARIKAYDPQGEKEGKLRFKDILDKVEFCNDEYETMKCSDAIVLLTEWNAFRHLDLERIQSIVSDKYFFDLRNIYLPEEMSKKGFKYYSVGR